MGEAAKYQKRDEKVNNQDNMNQKFNIMMYTTEDGLAKIEATFDEDTVWLSIDHERISCCKFCNNCVGWKNLSG